MSVAAQEQAGAGLWQPLEHCWSCFEPHLWLVGTRHRGASSSSLAPGGLSNAFAVLCCKENSVSSADFAKGPFQKPSVFFHFLANGLSLFFIPLDRKLESAN